MNDPLKRPMFATGGSVYLSPALRYMEQNPDVFNASTANARARGLTGINSQGQVERDAALHYATYGNTEGRQWGGRTFMGGLLEPRLGDTFGLTEERKVELQNERDNIDNPPVEEPAKGLVSLIPLDELEADEAGQGDGAGMAEGGEVYETSPVVQGYLQANGDVLDHAVRVAQSQGLPPGQGFQRAVENAAREHWNEYGNVENRTIAGYTDDGASLMQQESEQIIRAPDNQGVFQNPVNPNMLAIAELLRGSRKIYNDPEDLYHTAFFGSDSTGNEYDPYDLRTTSQVDDLLSRIDGSLRDTAVGARQGDTNEDMVSRDIGPTIAGIFAKRGMFNEIPSIYETQGGLEGLTRAFGELGIDPRGSSNLTGDRGQRSYGLNQMYETIGGVPVSLGNLSESNILNLLNSRVNSGVSSLGPDNTDGNDIGDGGGTFVRYDNSAEINPNAGSFLTRGSSGVYEPTLPDGSLAPALIPGTGNPIETQEGYKTIGGLLAALPGLIEQAAPLSVLSGGIGTLKGIYDIATSSDLNPPYSTNPINQDDSMALSGTNRFSQFFDPVPNNVGFAGFSPSSFQSPGEGFLTLGEYDRSLVD